MQAEPSSAHLLWARVGCATSVEALALWEALPRHRTLPMATQGSHLPTAFVLLLGALQAQPRAAVAWHSRSVRAGDSYLFGGPVSIPEEAAAAIAPLEEEERGAEQEAQHEMPYTFSADAWGVSSSQIPPHLVT